MEAWLLKEFRDLRARFESEVVSVAKEPLVLQLDCCYPRGKTVLIQYLCNEGDFLDFVFYRYLIMINIIKYR